MKTIREIKGGLTAPAGFRSAAFTAGLKRSGKPDLALIVSDHSATVAGTFTTNRVKAAPLKVTIPRVARGRARAIVCNSGNANCCTGKPGIRDAQETSAHVAAHLEIPIEEVLVCSTGVIGKRMPMDKIHAAICPLVSSLSAKGGPATARAMMTTDTFPKECTVEFSVRGKKIRIGGACKGAGMIGPRMGPPHATMLCFLTTDAALSPRALQMALNVAVAQSFNCITVDGDTSTNDTVLLLANGVSKTSPPLARFQEALNHITLVLAKMIARDGEGATKLVTVRVQGAKTDADAALVARTIAESPLNKCSFAGGDPNWGRLMDAIGYSGARVVEDKIEIRYNDVVAVKKGVVGRAPSHGKSLIQHLRKIVAQKEFEITIRLHLGPGTATMYTCDFTKQYVQENLGE